MEKKQTVKTSQVQMRFWLDAHYPGTEIIPWLYPYYVKYCMKSGGPSVTRCKRFGQWLKENGRKTELNRLYKTWWLKNPTLW